MRYLRKKPKDTGIDISPLIDMVFILLIFFMVTTTFVKDMKLDLDRPGAASAQKASTKSIRLSIDKNSVVYLEGNPVKMWVLQSKIKDLLSKGSSKSILVITDKKVSVDKLVDVMDQCKLAGATDIAVATQREAG